MTSYMRQEALSAPLITGQQLENYATILPSIISSIKNFSPRFIMTVGRGSSDHAASFAKYVFETQLGLVTSSAAPSIETIYRTPLQLKGALVVAFSQSGQSPDLCEVMAAAKKNGALTVAFVNKTESPLVSVVDYVIPLYAGDEKAVAATKSFIATLVAILAFTAYWNEDSILLAALKSLPLSFGVEQEAWSHVAKEIATRTNALVLGRGFTFPIALEAALKLKETCKLHAEAFSSAEVLHGPFALMKQDFPIVVFVPTDNAVVGLTDLLDRLSTISTCTYLFIPRDRAEAYQDHSSKHSLLLLPDSFHPLCDPLIAIHAFYLLAETCAQYRGTNPDKPDYLSKVTNTR